MLSAVFAPCGKCRKGGIQSYFSVYRANPFASSAIRASDGVYFRVKKTFVVCNHLDTMFRTNLRTGIASTAVLFLLVGYRHAGK